MPRAFIGAIINAFAKAFCVGWTCKIEVVEIRDVELVETEMEKASFCGKDHVIKYWHYSTNSLLRSDALKGNQRNHDSLTARLLSGYGASICPPARRCSSLLLLKGNGY